jgi:hypothetical protein
VIDHLGIPVSDLARATEFYLAALEPLGYGIVMQVSAEQTAMARRSASAQPAKRRISRAASRHSGSARASRLPAISISPS